MRITPYLRLMRLHQPTGIFLLLWPCLWGIALASHGIPDYRLLILFSLGAVLMRSAGCIINDIIDREIDAQVERTKTRPLASGELTVKKAIILLIPLLIASAVILFMLNKSTIWLGFFSLILVGTYPFMKRVTYWPQAFLGLTFNWGILMGWDAVWGHLTRSPFLLYAGAFCWTIGYDTIYAHQDKISDMLIGVKSTAIGFGEKTKERLKQFYDGFALLVVLAAITVHARYGFYFAMVVVWMHLYMQVKLVDLDNPASCMKIFKSNSYLGAIVLIAIVAGKLW